MANVKRSIGNSPYGPGTRWSFPKASRFRTLRSSSAEFVILPSSFSKSRSPSFGYGRRWEPKNPCGQDSPPATKYSTKSCFDLQIAGPSFGRPTHRNNRAFIPPSNTPGPGEYETERRMGENGPKFTMKSRKVINRVSDTPPPGHYSPSTSFQEDHSYSGITFGVGLRPSLISHRSALPGPGAYDLPSLFHSALPSIRRSVR